MRQRIQNHNEQLDSSNSKLTISKWSEPFQKCLIIHRITLRGLKYLHSYYLTIRINEEENYVQTPKIYGNMERNTKGYPFQYKFKLQTREIQQNKGLNQSCIPDYLTMQLFIREKEDLIEEIMRGEVRIDLNHQKKDDESSEFEAIIFDIKNKNKAIATIDYQISGNKKQQIKQQEEENNQQQILQLYKDQLKEVTESKENGPEETKNIFDDKDKINVSINPNIQENQQISEDIQGQQNSSFSKIIMINQVSDFDKSILSVQKQAKVKKYQKEKIQEIKPSMELVNQSDEIYEQNFQKDTNSNNNQSYNSLNVSFHQINETIIMAQRRLNQFFSKKQKQVQNIKVNLEPIKEQVLHRQLTQNILIPQQLNQKSIVQLHKQSLNNSKEEKQQNAVVILPQNKYKQKSYIPSNFTYLKKDSRVINPNSSHIETLNISNIILSPQQSVKSLQFSFYQDNQPYQNEKVDKKYEDYLNIQNYDNNTDRIVSIPFNGKNAEIKIVTHLENKQLNCIVNKRTIYQKSGKSGTVQLSLNNSLNNRKEGEISFKYNIGGQIAVQTMDILQYMDETIFVEQCQQYPLPQYEKQENRNPQSQQQKAPEKDIISFYNSNIIVISEKSQNQEVSLNYQTPLSLEQTVNHKQLSFRKSKFVEKQPQKEKQQQIIPKAALIKDQDEISNFRPQNNLQQNHKQVINGKTQIQKYLNSELACQVSLPNLNQSSDAKKLSNFALISKVFSLQQNVQTPFKNKSQINNFKKIDLNVIQISHIPISQPKNTQMKKSLKLYTQQINQEHKKTPSNYRSSTVHRQQKRQFQVQQNNKSNIINSPIRHLIKYNERDNQYHQQTNKNRVVNYLNASYTLGLSTISVYFYQIVNKRYSKTLDVLNSQLSVKVVYNTNKQNEQSYCTEAIPKQNSNLMWKCNGFFLQVDQKGQLDIQIIQTNSLTKDFSVNQSRPIYTRLKITELIVIKQFNSDTNTQIYQTQKKKMSIYRGLLMKDKNLVGDIVMCYEISKNYSSLYESQVRQIEKDNSLYNERPKIRKQLHKSTFQANQEQIQTVKKKQKAEIISDYDKRVSRFTPINRLNRQHYDFPQNKQYSSKSQMKVKQTKRFNTQEKSRRNSKIQSHRTRLQKLQKQQKKIIHSHRYIGGIIKFTKAPRFQHLSNFVSKQQEPGPGTYNVYSQFEKYASIQ